MDLLKGNVRQIYFRYLGAAFGSALISSIYGLVDSAMVGQYQGPEGTAALAIVAPVWNIIYSLGLLTGIGGSVLLSAARGAGRQKEGDEYFTAALAGTVFFAAVSWLAIAFFDAPLLRLFGARDALLPLAQQYLLPVKFVVPLFLFNQMLAAFLRNDGAPGLAMAAVVTGGLWNCFGDWYFCFPLDMGMAGAAIATVSGASLQALIMATHFLRRGKCHLRLVWPQNILRDMRRIVTLGFGAGVLDLGNVFIAIIINNQILRYGSGDYLAVYGVVSTISLLFQALFAGAGQASQPLISMNYGARKLDRVQAVLRMGLATVGCMGVVFMLLGEFFPTQITRLFIAATPEVLAAAPLAFRCYFIFFIFLGISVLATYYLQSIMRERAAMTVSVLRSLVLSITLLFVLPMFFGLPGVFLAMPLSEGIVAVIALILVRRSMRA